MNLKNAFISSCEPIFSQNNLPGGKLFPFNQCPKFGTGVRIWVHIRYDSAVVALKGRGQ